MSDFDFFDGRPMFYDRRGQPMTRDEYASAKYESDAYRRIGQDTLVIDGEPCNVLTVWLGIDHAYGTGCQSSSRPWCLAAPMTAPASATPPSWPPGRGTRAPSRISWPG
jgi:hypothetical protein